MNLEIILKPEELTKEIADEYEIIEAYDLKGNFIECEWEKNLFDESCIPMRPFWLIDWTIKNKIIDEILEAKDQKEVFNILQKIPAIAGFLAYQIFVDFTYIPEYPFSENEFTVSGPGCSRGLDILFSDKDGLTDEELIFWIRDNQSSLFSIDRELFSDLPDYDKTLTVMDIENCLCEHSKHTKLVMGTGRPKIKYSGKEEKAPDLF